MTSIEWADAMRTYCGAVSLILVVLFLRLFVQRALRYGIGLGVNPHPFTSLGIAALFTMSALRRREGVGDPPDIYLWAAVSYLTLILLGMFLAISWRPPWRERREVARPTQR